ncbi:MAG: acetyltransferase [Waterburya sp.]
MLLKNKEDDGLIEISEVTELIDPFKDEVSGQMQEGQNEQPPELFKKEDLVFPSGESLPLCWLDGNYKLKK